MTTLDYDTGTPTEQGTYACRLPIDRMLYEDKFLSWIGGRWSYPGSDQNYRGSVPYFIGPLRRRMSERREAWEKADRIEDDEPLLRHALDALEYHREQTRPIDRTDAAIAALRLRLGEKT